MTKTDAGIEQLNEKTTLTVCQGGTSRLLDTMVSMSLFVSILVATGK
jgi:hypothetical protein